jgi:tetratricopeptide (TPR) repeat protein
MLVGNKKYFSHNINEALPWYERAYKFNHASPSVKTTYAYILLRQGIVDKAEVILTEVMKQKLNERDKVSATLNLSLVLWKKDNLDEAIKLLTDLYDTGLKTTLLYQNLGFFYILKGDLENALAFNKEALEYNNADASILDNLALNYYLMEDYRKAEEAYEKLMPMNPTFVTSYYYYGLTLEKLHKYDEALETLKKALKYRFSFLSAVKKEDVEKEINRLEQFISETK